MTQQHQDSKQDVKQRADLDSSHIHDNSLDSSYLGSSHLEGIYVDKLAEQGLTYAEVIDIERKLAKFANTMDSLFRIPFTKQGVGTDAALATIPMAGDIAGLLLTGYAFMLGRQLGVPMSKLIPAVRLAFIDLFIGVIPVAGPVMDIFIRPSRRTLEIVRDHMHSEYGIVDTSHIDRPFMHESLQKKQQQSKFLRNPIAAWLYLHVPDILGVIMVLFIIWITWVLGSWVVQLF